MPARAIQLAVCATVVAGGVAAGAHPVAATTEPASPAVIDCSTAGPADPDASTPDGPLVHIEVEDSTDGFGSLSSRTTSGMTAGPATIEVRAAADNPGPADVTVSRDGVPVLQVVGVAPDALCSAAVDFEAGLHVATSSVTADSDVDWEVGPAVEHAPAAEILDLTGVAGADQPIVIGETVAQMGDYTDACDTLSPELITAALPEGVGTIESVDHPATWNMTPEEGEWAPTCHWEVAVTGGAHSSIAVEVYFPFPELAGIDFGLVYDGDAADPAFVDLSSIGENCYFIRSTANCPYGTYAIQVLILADGEPSDEFQQTATSLLANMISRLQPVP